MFVCWASQAALACGSRTGLSETDLPRPTDAAVDAGIDPARDAGTDAGRPCGPPVEESCNGRDDDCDGRVDEDLRFGAVRPRVLVRTTEGTTGACGSCRWAAGAQLWVHDDGMLAVWRMGFDGSRPQPNAWARRLDLDANPLGEPFVLFDTSVPNGFRLAPVSASRAALAFCGRLPADVMASAFLDPTGRVVVAPAIRNPMGFGCGAHHPDVAYAAGQGFFSWTNNRGGLAERAVLLDLVDGEGRSTASREVVDSSADLTVPPRFGVGPASVALVTGYSPEPRTTLLRFVLLGLDGSERARVDIEPPPETRWGDTDVATAPDGWLIVGTDRTSFDAPVGRALVRLDADGVVREGPINIEPGWEWSRVDLEPLPGGGFVLGGLLESPDGARGVAVMRLDDEGRRVDVWRPEVPTFFGLTGFDLVVSGARVFLIYAGPAADLTPNEVVLHELGCVE